MGKANITDTAKAAASNTHSVKPKPIYDFVKRVSILYVHSSV